MPSQPTVESPDPGMLLSGERRVLELIATGSPLAETLDALCQAIDDQTSLTSAVYLLNREGDRFLLAAGPHLPQVWRDATCSYRADATIGACGAAVHLRHEVIVPNVPDSALFDLWREAAAAAHIGSAWSTPFFSTDGRALGTFAVFAHSSGDPDAQFLGVVGRATGLASIAVERHLTELELRESERRCSTAATQMRALATRLMRVQDDERRRIAQTLHETTAQDLAGLKMLLARLVRSGLAVSDADRALLLESIDLAERSMSGVRTLSYLLHPPFLDENGLLSALRWYAKGFADRSGITVDLDLPATFGRLPQDVETASVSGRTGGADQHSSPCAKRNRQYSADGGCRSSDPGNRGSRSRHVAGSFVERHDRVAARPALALPVCANVSSSLAAASTSSRAIAGRPSGRRSRSRRARHEPFTHHHRRRSRRRSPWSPRAARIAAGMGGRGRGGHRPRGCRPRETAVSGYRRHGFESAGAEWTRCGSADSERLTAHRSPSPDDASLRRACAQRPSSRRARLRAEIRRGREPHRSG